MDVLVRSATEEHSDDSDRVVKGVSSAKSSLPTDEVFHLLQSERCRAVVCYLCDVEGPVKMRDVTEQVAVGESDTTPDAITSNERRQVYIPLYQSQLPKLNEEGAIDYEKDRSIVQKTGLVAQLARYLDLDDLNATNDVPSHRWGVYRGSRPSASGLDPEGEGRTLR